MGSATSYLVHDFIFSSAERAPASEALVDGARRLTYAQLATLTKRTCAALRARGARRGERVAVYMEKNIEHVAALFGACLLYTSPSPRDRQKSRMPSSA